RDFDASASNALPFDLARAHAFYKALLGPAQALIKDKHLLVVPSGPLTSLPFGVLVTEPTRSAIPALWRLSQGGMARHTSADQRPTLGRESRRAAPASEGLGGHRAVPRLRRPHPHGPGRLRPAPYSCQMSGRGRPGRAQRTHPDARRPGAIGRPELLSQ